jgi:Flavin containing amine oxidoreductase
MVVLAVGLGAVPKLCREILEQDDRWQAMVEHVRSVPTQAFQLWLDADRAELGRPGPPTNVSGFVEPFDTWADMTHVAATEAHAVPPRSIAYFCNVLPRPAGPRAATGEAWATWYKEQNERVKDSAVRFLEQDVAHLWPGAVHEGRFRWELLSPMAAEGAPDGAAPSARASAFNSQFWTANVRPSDAYTQALPGSARYRISPLEATYKNLTIAGDWTQCGLNMGCVEAAVMSGRLAAHAISQHPALESIVGYDHP